MAATPNTKIQISWSDKSPLPMVNVYAESAEECDLLVDYVDQHFAGWIAVGHHAHATSVTVAQLNATPVAAPAAAGQALPQPVPQAAPSGHMCDCTPPQPMKLRNGQFGTFYSCPKPMSDHSRCSKKINA